MCDHLGHDAYNFDVADASSVEMMLDLSRLHPHSYASSELSC